MIRVLLVDDQALVRSGLRLILSADPEIELVGECADGDEVLEAVSRTSPDVILMDIRMKRVDGAEATRHVRALADPPAVLVLTTFDDDEVLSSALRAGASGFQLKDVSGESLLRAVHALAEGGAWLDPAVTARVLSSYRSGGDSEGGGQHATGLEADRAADALTRREREVLELIGRGATNGEIAARLFVSEVTVKTHVGHIFMKLGVRDRAGAIVFAFDHGIVTPAAG